jgi:hypothetical protein
MLVPGVVAADCSARSPLEENAETNTDDKLIGTPWHRTQLADQVELQRWQQAGLTRRWSDGEVEQCSKAARRVRACASSASPPR